VSEPIHSGSDPTPADASDSAARRILRRWPTLVALIVMWIALWGDLSVANVVGGTIVAVAVMGFAGRVQPRPTQHVDPRAAVSYLFTFLRQLAEASWQVARAVVRPDRIKPGILAMPLYGASDAVVTLVANSITLTPGTLTLETARRDDDVAILYVHALDLSDADDVREDICQLELLAVDAFAGPAAQAVQARTLADLEEREGLEGAPADAGDGSDRADDQHADDEHADDESDEGSGRP
jgi:multicomponent Na+:H+ antiporter subunit E